MKWQKKVDDEGVSPVIAIILMVAITVVLAGVLYVWVTSLADTTAGVSDLRFDGELETNSGGTAAVLTLTHRGGDEITWSDYQVTLNGTALTGSVSTASVGEATTFTLTYTGTNDLVINEQYVVRIINIDSQSIDWEDTLTNKQAT